MLKLWHKSLKLRLLITICGLTVLGTLLLAQLVADVSRQQIRRDQGQILYELTREIVHQLDQDLKARRNELRFFSHASALFFTAEPTTRLALLHNIKETFPHYAWIGITDAEGNIILGTDGFLVGKNVSKRNWFLRGKKGLYLGDAHDAFLLAKLMPKPQWDNLPLRLVDVAMPILDHTGNFAGVVCAHLSLDWAFEVRNSLLSMLGDETVELILLNQQGKVMIGSPAIPSLSINLGDNINVWQQHQENSHASSETWPDGTRYLTSILSGSKQPMIQAMGWTVVARKAEALAFRPANILRQQILLIGGGTALLLGLLIWWLIHRQLYTLERISRVAERIRKHERNVRIPHIKGVDELATFSRSLTELVDQLQYSNAQLSLTNRVFEESGQAIVITDARLRVLRVNAALNHICGYDESTLKGRIPHRLLSTRHSPRFYRKTWQQLRQKGVWRGELWTQCQDGSVIPQALQVYSLCEKNGRTCYYIAQMDDLREKKRQEAKLLQLANYDVLTQLPNRHALQQCMTKIMHRTTTSCALLFLDLNQFKHINDTMGHARGDIVLQEVASRLQSSANATQMLARWGGDEFVLFAANCDHVQALHLAQHLLDTLKPPVMLEGRPYHIGGSIGLSLFPQHSQSVDGLLRCADTAMYEAKKESSSCLRTYAPWMNESLNQFLQTDRAMRHAIAMQGTGFSLCYQPQYTLDRQRIHGVEVLLRWHEESLGRISPSEFIPVAEETGQILPLGRWVIEQALQDLLRLKATGCRLPILALNCSPKQLQSKNFTLDIQQACAKYHIPCQQIRIEVTESAIMSDEQRAIKTLHELRQAGCTLSIDDFGTGYASLQYLHQIQPDELKIDQSFVVMMDEDEHSRHIVNFSIDLAHSMDMEVVIEGVESPQVLALLHDHQMASAYPEYANKLFIQGYIFSRPLSYSALQHLLKEEG